jgi:hypothetical protein
MINSCVNIIGTEWVRRYRTLPGRMLESTTTKINSGKELEAQRRRTLVATEKNGSSLFVAGETSEIDIICAARNTQ